jgi:hypothetical protein
MSDDDLALLKASIDGAVVLDTVHGEHILAKPLIVYEEGDTPDVFFLEVERGPDGTYVEKGRIGHSVLLSEIVAVHRAGVGEPT